MKLETQNNLIIKENTIFEIKNWKQSNKYCQNLMLVNIICKHILQNIKKKLFILCLIRFKHHLLHHL